jgi:ISXO2-like transposase domain
MRIRIDQLSNLIDLYLNRNSVKDAHDIMSFMMNSININTISKYFRTFSLISLQNYIKYLDTTIMEDIIEVDETHLFKVKKTSAPHREYALGSIWLVGILERKSKKFVMIPTTKRDETTLIPLLLKFCSLGSKIMTDSFSVYVNNRKNPKDSKLDIFGFIHYYVNHNTECVLPNFDDIHINTIERMWKDFKDHLKKVKVKANYLFELGRYHITRTYDIEDQKKIIWKGLLGSKLPSLEELRFIFNQKFDCHI